MVIRIFMLIIGTSLHFHAATSEDGVAMIIGGFGGGNSIEIFVSHTESCMGNEAHPPIGQAPFGTLFHWFSEYVDNSIYLCGGSDLTANAECYYYSLEDASWKSGCEMQSPRKEASSLVYNNVLYALGGFNDEDYWLDSVEMKSPGSCQWQTESWKLLQPMKLTCAAQINTTHIIIIGGSVHSFSHPELSDVSIFNMETKEWTSAAPMDTPKAGHKCINYNHNGEEGILVVGGCTEMCHTHLKEVEFYSPQNDKWTKLPSLILGRNDHGLTMLGGKPTVFGGYNHELMGDIEYYENGAWHRIPNSLQFPRWAFGMPRNLSYAFSCV